MSKDKSQNKEKPAPAGPAPTIEATLLALARPKMTPRELLKAARKAHPDASKKEIVRAAFRSIISVADSDSDKAQILQNFALQERAVDDV
ncbi:MAG: hypothetical protein ABI697_00995 [Devosia sp.]